MGANKYETLSKVAAAYGSITGAVIKFEKGGTKNIVAGVADLTTAVSNFLPPPANMLVGIISSTISTALAPVPTVSQVSDVIATIIYTYNNYGGQKST